MTRHEISLRVNGRKYDLTVDSRRTLLRVIREDLGLKGTKKGCEEGECGACSVIVDGRVVDSCLYLAVEADGKEILTIEGLRRGRVLHPLQQSFIDHGAFQCGYCTPGMILTAKALLDKNPHPTEEEVRKGIEGNFCRCTGYQKIVQAILAAAGREDVTKAEAPAGKADP